MTKIANIKQSGDDRADVFGNDDWRVGAGKPQAKGYFKNGRFLSLRREASRGNMYINQASNLLENLLREQKLK